MLPIPSYENSRDVNWPKEINFMLSLINGWHRNTTKQNEITAKPFRKLISKERYK